MIVYKFGYNRSMTHKKEVFIHQKFNDEDLMKKSSANWNYDTVYKLLPYACEGENTMIFLPHIQLTYVISSGGILYDINSPGGTVSAGVVLEAESKACFGQTKLKKGMVVFFDDRKSYSLFISRKLKISIISFPKKTYRKLSQMLSKHNLETIEDTDSRLSTFLSDILESFKNNPSIMENTEKQEEIETHLLEQLSILLEKQTPAQPKLTKGEKIALQIRDRIYCHISKKVTISSLAEEFRISEQTLQNAFKSLFGFTPNRFLRHIKLNHVRQTLIHADPQSDTIVRIANKWGFTHMGHFSRYYTDLFGENPSVTLNRKPEEEKKTGE
ncbi:helix-turn-helix domain-containing protein [Sulfurovum sp. ST-21]|uniref:Helix-turn-helix domain-containing protein n=1 Tax=Sulfurovum indicum TaxID=2779528 RepID=A0A7M1S2K0_9BACT|nr:helix-turn-helix domain-containing protein [Sulfurovum indicum]QOR61556.1 helix-turn-helix domain-containing protein [Sulfurovum indicum]